MREIVNTLAIIIAEGSPTEPNIRSHVAAVIVGQTPGAGARQYPFRFSKNKSNAFGSNNLGAVAGSFPQNASFVIGFKTLLRTVALTG